MSELTYPRKVWAVFLLLLLILAIALLIRERQSVEDMIDVPYDVTTVEEALKTASPGDHILLRDPEAISFPLEITVEGITLECDKEIQMNVPAGQEGIIIKSYGAIVDRLGSPDEKVIKAGGVTIRSCHFTGGGVPIVLIAGQLRFPLWP